MAIRGGWNPLRVDAIWFDRSELGDIFPLDLEPARGKQQRGRRYMFVVSPAQHNRRGHVIALPISQGETLDHSLGFANRLMGAGTQTQAVVI